MECVTKHLSNCEVSEKSVCLSISWPGDPLYISIDTRLLENIPLIDDFILFNTQFCNRNQKLDWEIKSGVSLFGFILVILVYIRPTYWIVCQWERAMTDGADYLIPYTTTLM